MRYSYYPGCTLKTKANNFEKTALRTAGALGLEMVEVPEWQCCGALYPLNTDELFPLLAPVRALAQAKEAGHGTLVTLCAGCYNVFKRTNREMSRNGEVRRKVNGYLQEEYTGEVNVLHYLEVLKKEVGFASLAEKAQKKLTGRKVAPYYGCLLLKPRDEMDFDDVENPTIFEDFLRALGAEPVDYPYKTECCGSYLSMADEEVAATAVGRILLSARKSGAELLVVACPLCRYNLEEYGRELTERTGGEASLPVLYFTELLAEALAVGSETYGEEK
jgi:heterodisulfide reductase subunit B